MFSNIHMLNIIIFLRLQLYFQFGALTPLEPRLGKKLIEPLTNLIHRYFMYFCLNVNQYIGFAGLFTACGLV